MILDGEHSDWISLTNSGCPSGIHSRTDAILEVVEHCTVNLYADDTTTYSTDENLVVLWARIEKDLERAANWIRMNGLKMNVAKTQLMVRTYQKREVSDSRQCWRYMPEQCQLPGSEDWQGLILQNADQPQCRAKLAIIRRASHYLPQNVRRLLYQAFV